jgi:hypothetical protein
MYKLSAVISYVLSLCLVSFGWLCLLAQGDAQPGQPRIAGIVLIFVIALLLLVLPAALLREAKRGVREILLVLLSIQAIVCVYVIFGEFTL